MFDARSAKLLAPGAHLTIDDAPGLRLEATRTTRTWVYRYKSPVDGRMRQKKIGHWPAMPYQAAWVEWEALRARRDAGGDPSLEAKTQRHETRKAVERAKTQVGPLLVSQVCSQYVDHLKKVRQEKGWSEVERMFESMLGDDANKPAEGYSRRDAFDLIERWASIPVQAKKLRAELGAAWDHALDGAKLSEDSPNWWRLIMRGKLKSKGKRINGKHIGTDKRWLRVEEVGGLVCWLPNFSALIEDTLLLYLWTGCRGEEIVQIEGSEVTEEDGVLWWTCPKSKTKNSWRENAGDLRVPLVGRAAAIVRRRIQRYGSGYLFQAKGRDGSIGYTQQKTIQSTVYYYQPYCKTRKEHERPRLPVTNWAPHDLRRTVRTTLASMGCAEEIAEAVLGHIAPGVKGVYNRHRYDGERLEWLTKLAEHWESAVLAYQARLASQEKQ